MTETPELPKITPELPKPPANPPDAAAPAIPEAAKAGPAKVEPVKSEPAPAAPELAKSGPVKVGPAKSEPDAAAPAAPKPAPEKSEPSKAAVPPASAAPPRPRPRAQASRSALAVLSAVGFLLLAGAMFYLWQQVQILARQSDPSQIAVLNGEIRELRQRVARLEQQPAPVPPAPPVDLGPLTARVEALEQRPAAAPDNNMTALSAEVTALQGRVAQAEANAGQVSDAASRSARLQAAGVALAFGQPLGNIPGGPPALTRFATANPPTEASLRQEFSAAARQAQAVSQPDTSKLTLGARIWQRVTSLATVRQGNTVLVGAPAAVALGSAQDKLEAGDLAGAVAALDTLDGPAAQAMSDWRAKAQSLLDARAALAAMAHG